MNRRVSISLIFAILILSVCAQAQETVFRAFASSNSITKDEFFELTFQIENGKVSDFQPPIFTGFNVLSGPVQSVRTAVINGKVSSSRSYTYTLEPQRTGQFTLGPATAIINGERKESNHVSITVTTGSDNTSTRVSGSGDVFVRLEPSATVAYPGQQLSLDYKVYTRTEVSSFSLDRSPDIKGAYVKECKNYNTSVRQVQVNGNTYVTKITRRQTMYPTTPGTISSDPAVITLGIPDPDEDPFSTLFGTSRPRQVKTNALSINVKPLPAPVPADFSGAVGNFSYTLSASTGQLTTSDALRLTFTISGNGDIKRVKNPEFAKDTLFEIYDAQVTGEQEREEAGNWVNSRTYTIDILPRVPGEYELQIPPFVYFDTEARNYKTIQPEPVPLIVTKGQDKPAQRQPVPTEPEVSQPGFWEQYKTWVPGVAGGLLALALIVLLARRKKPKTVNNTVTEEITATENITATVPEVKEQPEVQPVDSSEYQRGLDEASVALRRADMPHFYFALNQTLGKRLAERLQIPFSAFTRQRVQEAAEAQGLDTATCKEIDQILARLEFANYAHYYQQEDAPQLLEQVRTLLARI